MRKTGINFVDFYANYLSGKPRVGLVEVPESVTNTTGIVQCTDCGTQIAIMGKRNVRRPREGYRYHEYRLR